MSRTYAGKSSIQRDIEAAGETSIYFYRYSGIMLYAPIATTLGAATLTLGANIVTNDKPALATIFILSTLLACSQILAIIKWCSNFFVLTSKRLILSTSPIAGQSVTIKVSRGLEIDLRRSWQGYLFGYGKFSIKDHAGKYEVNYVKYPQYLYSELSSIIRSAEP